MSEWTKYWDKAYKEMWRNDMAIRGKFMVAYGKYLDELLESYSK